MTATTTVTTPRPALATTTTTSLSPCVQTTAPKKERHSTPATTTTTTYNKPNTNASVLAHKSGDARKLVVLIATTIALWRNFSSPVCYLPLLLFSGGVLVKPKTLAQHAANIALAAVWSLHSMLMVKVLSLGMLSANSGCLIPYLSLAYLAQRGKNPLKSHSHSSFSRLIVKTFFDPPLVLGTLIAKPLGVHLLHDGLAACNFLTVVDDHIVMSSMPASSDIPEMLDAKVGAVVNLQGEWSGPIAAYASAGIKQLRLPTTDMECPTLQDLTRGVEWMEKQLESSPDKRILVHCKGGRGRATTMALAFYIKKGMEPVEAFERIQKVRPVVEPIVLTYPALIEFAAKCKGQ